MARSVALASFACAYRGLAARSLHTYGERAVAAKARPIHCVGLGAKLLVRSSSPTLATDLCTRPRTIRAQHAQYILPESLTVFSGGDLSARERASRGAKTTNKHLG